MHGAFALGFAGEKRVEVGAIPVSVGDLVAGARRHEELVAPLGVGAEGPAGRVRVEREAALQAAGDLGALALPRSPGGERPDARQVVTRAEILEEEVGERRRGLSDRKPRVRSAFEEHDRPPQPPGEDRRERAGEARADDGDVEVGPAHGVPAGLAADRREGGLREVHRGKPRPPAIEAGGAAAPARRGPRGRRRRGPRRRPRPSASAVLEEAERRRLEGPGIPQGVHGAVAGAGRDDGDGGRAAVERELDRPARPSRRCSAGSTHGRPARTKTRRATPPSERARAARRKESSVMRLLRRGSTSGMDRLEAHGDLEIAVEKVPEVEDRRSHERGVALDDRALEGSERRGDRGMVFRGNGPAVEEAAGVVELDPAGRRKRRERLGDLGRDRPGAGALLERVLPQVAHQASPGALAVRQEDGGDVDCATRLVGLRLDEGAVGAPRVEGIARGPAFQDPAVPRAGRVRVGRAHGGLTRRATGSGRGTGLRPSGTGPASPVGKRAVLEPSLGKDRHRLSRDRRDAPRHDVALQVRRAADGRSRSARRRGSPRRPRRRAAA